MSEDQPDVPSLPQYLLRSALEKPSDKPVVKKIEIRFMARAKGRTPDKQKVKIAQRPVKYW